MQAWEVKIRGIVQGVGFRPFIHRLVREFGLRGSIRNTSSGVTLELEGETAQLEAFLEKLPETAPPWRSSRTSPIRTSRRRAFGSSGSLAVSARASGTP